MKKLILISLIVINILGFNSHSFAQDGATFDKGTFVITAGYGFPDLYNWRLRGDYNGYYKGYSSTSVRGFGPIIIKGDYGIVKFKWGHSLGIGAVIGYNSTTVNYNYNHWNNSNNWGYYNQTYKYRTITIGARGTYHFFTKEKIDLYANVGLGFNINSYTQNTNDPYKSNYIIRQRSGLYGALTVGIRYYFTKNFGVYSELGWDMSTPIQVGLSFKF
jgi:hypothetical protein